MPTEHPDHQPHRRYTVTLRPLRGASKNVKVITNRGEAKAAYLAAFASGGFARKPQALDVEVHDDGPARAGFTGRACTSRVCIRSR